MLLILVLLLLLLLLLLLNLQLYSLLEYGTVSSIISNGLLVYILRLYLSCLLLPLKREISARYSGPKVLLGTILSGYPSKAYILMVITRTILALHIAILLLFTCILLTFLPFFYHFFDNLPSFFFFFMTVSWDDQRAMQTYCTCSLAGWRCDQCVTQKGQTHI